MDSWNVPSVSDSAHASFIYKGVFVRVYVEAAGGCCRLGCARRGVGVLEGGFGFGAGVENRDDGNAVNFALPEDDVFGVSGVSGDYVERWET